MCRFCSGAVESPEHAFLECTANLTLPLIRARFLAQVECLRPDLVPPVTTLVPAAALRALIDWPELVHALAAFTHAVLSVFTSIEYAWPAEFMALPRPRQRPVQVQR